MAKVLIVEDDKELARLVSESLSFEHFVVDMAHTGQDGLDNLEYREYDLVILDVELPGMTGLELLKNLRERRKDTPVLMLTGRTTISDKEKGLDAGADDYLTKPFHMRELIARVRALIRRSGGKLSGNVLTAGNIILDPQSFQVTKDGKEIKLMPKEFALLEFLMRHPRVVFSAEALLSRVWRADEDASSDIIRTHVKNLRKKIDPDGTTLHTIHGVGYKIDPPVS